MTADAARSGLLARYPLFFFFLLSFVLTWGYFWLIWAPLGLPHSLIALGGFGRVAPAVFLRAISANWTRCYLRQRRHCAGRVLDRLNRPFGGDGVGVE